MTQTRLRVAAEVNANHAAAAARERAKVAKCLCLLEDAEAVRLAGHWEIDLVISGNLNEDSAVWSAFVKLAGRVEKSWPIADCSRALRTIPYSSSQLLECAIGLGRLFDVIQKRDVVVRFDRLQLRSHGVVIGDRFFFVRQFTRLRKLAQQLAR